MPAPNLIPQGGGAFVGSMPQDPDPAPPKNLQNFTKLFTSAQREEACPTLDITGRWSFCSIYLPGSTSRSS
jgi:hypothetical protein